MLTPLGLRWRSPFRGMLPSGSGRKAHPEALSFEKRPSYTSLAYHRKKLALGLYALFAALKDAPSHLLKILAILSR